MTPRRNHARRRRSQAGFTLIEVMVAVLLTAIAVVGIVGLYRVQTRSSSFSRRTTEASVLAADKMEVLRTTNVPISGTEANLDSRGITATAGTPGHVFTRTWTVGTLATAHELTVAVSWDEDGQPRNVTLRSVRGL